jgi:hydrogenase maturation factor
VTADAASSDPICGSDHCITCGDDGVPMLVVEVDRERGLAICADQTGALTSVETALVEPVAAGDELLVHAAVAIAALDGAEVGA